MILRDLMADKLPKEVLWCRGKPHLGWLFNASVTRAALSRGDLDEKRLADTLGNYVDSAALSTAWHQFRENDDAEQLDLAYQLSVWLRTAAARPVVPD